MKLKQIQIYYVFVLISSLFYFLFFFSSLRRGDQSTVFAHYTVYYKVSRKEMSQFALNSLKKILKRKKSISDLLVMALPEHVVAGLSTSSSFFFVVL